MEYTIKEIADMAGITTRTLRYYDEVGLLEPSRIGVNGYRYYDYANILQLQQILFYRELDVPINEIQDLISQPDHHILKALKRHRQNLKQKAKRVEKLIETIDQTILTLKGEGTMTDTEYFDGFDESKYEKEAREQWGGSAKYSEAQAKWSSYTDSQKKGIKEEGHILAVSILTQDPKVSPHDAAVQNAVGEYFRYFNKYFYTCDIQSFRLLADMWVDDPRFAANYERIRKGGAAFIQKAVHIYCDNAEG